MLAIILHVLMLLFAVVALGEATPKVVSMRMYRKEQRSVLQKRSPVSTTIGNALSNGLYYVNATVGTPPQLVQLQVDTGSSDVWMFGVDSCDTQTSQCLGGSFDRTQSSSYTLLEQGEFNITYFTPNSGVTGDYIADDFALGSTTIQNLTMGLATHAAYVSTGIMGISFDTDESISGAGGNTYPNIIDMMVQQNIISTRAYSLWLDDLEDASGTILFGGYDTDKYTGQLSLLKIYPDSTSGIISTMTVAWTSLSVTDSSGTTELAASDFPIPAILDSGTTVTVLPSDMYSQLASYFGAVTDQTYGVLVSCSIGSTVGSLNYGFGGAGGPTISVSFSELALPLYGPAGNPLTFQDGSAACSFGLGAAAEGEPYLLGDTFLRSAYVVYDLDSQEIGLAQTDFNSTSSNIVEIGSGNIVGASSVALDVSVTQTATANLPPGGVVISGSETASQVQTMAPTGGFGSITGGKTTKPVTTSTVPLLTATATSPTAMATSSTATPTKSSATSLIPAFDLVGVLVVGSSFFLIVLGGTFVLFY